MNRFLPALLLAVAILLSGPRISAASPLRVAVVADSPGISDSVAAALSHDEGVEVIERAQIGLLLREGMLSQAMSGPDSRVQLGRLLGADAFIHLRPLSDASDAEWQIDIIDAPSGKILATKTYRVTPAKLAESALELFKTVQFARPEGRSRVAVIDFKAMDETGEIVDRSTALKLAQELRARLSENGVDVLDRIASVEVSNEQGLAENGLTGNAELPPMLGADYVVNGQWSITGRTLRISVLATHGGRLEAEKTFAFAAPGTPGLSEEIIKWTLAGVGGKAAVDQMVWAPSMETEALEPFYRGITLYQQGKPLDATVEFERAYVINDRFEEAYLWEARCYEAAGLQPLADIIKRFLGQNVLEFGVGEVITAAPVDGLTFLGVVNKNGNAVACRKLEFLATDALAGGSQRVLLPENLASLRDEYDVLVGVKNSRGVNWEKSPGFLTRQTLGGVLSKPGAAQHLQLTLNDTLSGGALATAEIELADDSAKWPEQVVAGVTQLLSNGGGGKSQPKPAQASDAEPGDIGTENRVERNLAIVKLALKDPGELASHWQPLQKAGWNFSDYANYGLRQYLLNTVPASNPNHAWMELEWISGFMNYNPHFANYTDAKIDPIAELQRFVKAHPDDFPGAIADYMLLFATMENMPYPEIEKRATVLNEKFHRFFSEPGRGGYGEISGMPDLVRQLAIVAQDDPARRIPVPDKHVPKEIAPRIVEGGEVEFDEITPWMARLWDHIDLTPEQSVQEARAALAFLGRGDGRFWVDSEWLRKYPRSRALTRYVLECIRTADTSLSLPMRHPFDAEADRAAYREMVNYAFDDIHHELQTLSNADELNEIEMCEVRRLLTDLTRPGYQVTVPDSEVNRMRDAFEKDVDEATTRVQRNHREGYPDEYLDWRKITRDISPFANKKWWNNDQAEIYDMDLLDGREKRTVRASADQTLLDSQWWQLMKVYEYETLPRMVRGQYYLEEFPKLLKDYDGLDIGNGESEQMIRYAITLLRGEHYQESEQLFQRVHDILEKREHPDSEETKLYLNSELFLAAMAIHFDRKPEAVRLLKHTLETAGGNPIRVCEEDEWHGARDEPLQVVAARLLSDLRQLTIGEERVGSLGKVLVRQAAYFPGEIPFYFHIPAGFDPKSGKKYRVLLFIGQANHGGVEYADGDNTWTRFADAHDLFLVVPHLLNYWTYPFHPQEFMGDATLQALEKIKKDYPVDTGRLLMVGYGSGANFMNRFALLHPEICGALSLNSIDNLEWWEALPEGEHPLSSLKQVPCLVTCEEESGNPYMQYGDFGNYSPMVRFVSYARAAGMPVIWKSFQHEYCGPTPEMEQITQAFLADVLDETGKKEHFTGDIRTWRYFPAGDNRIGDIPQNFRQELPSGPVAQLWGEEQK